MKTQNLITPVEVLVDWSESGVFPFEKKTYSFKDFELKAELAASQATEFYDKTQITVKFSNGIDYSCRLDLGANDKKGFRDHCNKMIEFSKTQKGLDFYISVGLLDCVNFLKSISWQD